jgi:hypothetical protein
MARTLPNLKLKAFFTLGEDNWNNDVDLNFLKLSAAIQANVISMVNTRPTNAVEGSMYLLSETEGSNPNSLAIFEGGTWTFMPPQTGWLVYDRAGGVYRSFNGTSWRPLALTDARVASLVAMDATPGLLTQIDANTLGKRSVGVSTSNDILSRGHGDARFAPIEHFHPDSVLSFNNRVGPVTLTPSDISLALGYIPQSTAGQLSALIAMPDTLGLLEQTGPNSIGKRGIGIDNASDILTRAHGDARYISSTPSLIALGSITSASGIVEQTGPATFTKRAIDADTTDSLVSQGKLDSLYTRTAAQTFVAAIDVPDSYSGKAGNTVRVNTSSNGVEFVPTHTTVLRDSTVTAYTVVATDMGQQLRMINAASVTVTLPVISSVVIGASVRFAQGGGGKIVFVAGSGASVTSLNAIKSTNGQYAVVEVRKISSTEWMLSGDLLQATTGGSVGAMLALTTLSPVDLGDPTLGRIAKVADATGDRYMATLNGKWSTLLGTGTDLVPGYNYSQPRIAVGSSILRNTTAYALTSTGLYSLIAANAPRFDYSPTGGVYRGILVEGARTNLVKKSSDYTTTPWTVTGAAISTTGTTAPDGTTAQKFSDNADAATSTVQLSINTLVMTAAGQATFSVFLKAGTRSRARFRVASFTSATGASTMDVNLALGTIIGGDGGTITPYGNGWYRITLTATLDAGDLSGSLVLQMMSDASSTSLLRDGTSNMFVWGMQAEMGATASSPIATTGTEATRGDDFLALDWSQQSVASGTINVKYTFDDATTQTVSTVVSGGISTVPTNLTRRWITRIEKI